MLKHIKNVLFLTIVFSTCANAQMTIFWEVKDTVNNKTSYLLGTMHVIGASFIDSFAPVQAALKNSDIAIFEKIDEGENFRSTVETREKSDSLRIILTKKEYNYLKSLDIKWTDDYLAKHEVMELKYRLIFKASIKVCGAYNKNDSTILLDDHLERKARSNNIALMGLETTEEQMEVMAIDQKATKKSWASERNSIRGLLKIIKDEKYHRMLCGAEKEYMNFEMPYDFDKSCPDEALIQPRNKKWLPKLVSQLSSKNCFIAVGFFHLKNDCGLITELKRKGFVITPIMLR